MRDAVGALLDKAARLRGAGVIDEDANAGVIAQACFHARQIAKLGQVRLKNIDGNVVFAAQPVCQCLQTPMVASDQDQIVPTLGETLGVNRADVGGSASDQNGGESGHGVTSFSGTSAVMLLSVMMMIII